MHVCVYIYSYYISDLIGELVSPSLLHFTVFAPYMGIPNYICMEYIFKLYTLCNTFYWSDFLKKSITDIYSGSQENFVRNFSWLSLQYYKPLKF